VSHLSAPNDATAPADVADFRNALLVVAGFNAVCMLVANFTMKARLPPRAPPPWKALLKPWQDPRYTFYVVGTAVALIKCVPTPPSAYKSRLPC
jgi:predicted MFS family arabinose efflux permease